MLSSIEYLPIYRSLFNDFDREFIMPSYSESNMFYRGAGYFSLRSLILSFEGLMNFVDNDGHMKIICSPELSDEDIALIEAGHKIDAEITIKDILEIIATEDGFSEDDILKLDIICNLIAENRLDIHIAFMEDGLYHEKYGIFCDKFENMVYFIGSANETVSAKVRNTESFSVTTSWAGELQKQIIKQELDLFKKIWNNDCPDTLTVVSFPDAVKQKMFDKYRKSSSLSGAILAYRNSKKGSKKKLYPYQELAIKEFLSNGYVHFYEMATGTGKTFTAIRTIKALKQTLEQPLFVVICVPQIDLQVQWKHALEEDGYSDVLLFGGVSPNTDDAISDATINSALGEDVICVSTYDTFFAKAYKNLTGASNLFLIVDEAHNLTPNQISHLPQSVKYKLGLSATIQRFSQKETDAIIEYFTKGTIKPYYYGIEDAINNHFLSRYKYFPIYTRLTEEEFSSYQKKTLSIATEMAKPNDEQDLELLNRLRNERSLIVKKASCKIDKLREMTLQDYDFHNSVVYCGQGKDKDNEEPIIDSVTKILHRADLSVHTFTSKTEDRPKVLKEFERGYFDTLVAIKCFDEGVDVPKLDKIYIMASDTALRQTVQRRGRVLRVCKETGKDMAYIYDMVVLPPSGYYIESGVKSLIVNELKRSREYARLAVNKDDSDNSFKDIYKRYTITEEDFENEKDD